MNENSCQFIFGKKCKKYEQNMVDFVVHKTRDFDYFVFENESKVHCISILVKMSHFLHVKSIYWRIELL